MSMSRTDYLKQYDDAYESAEGAMPLFSEGPHTAVITNAEIAESDRGISLQLNFRDDKAGQIGRKFLALDVPDRMGFTKADLTILGFDGKLSELEAFLPKIPGLVVEVNVVFNPADKSLPLNDPAQKIYRNVYINKLVGRDESVKAPPAPTSSGQTDDVPFAPTGGWWEY